MEEQERLKLNARVDVLNALSLAENLADLRIVYDLRLQAVENEVKKLNELVEKQSQMIGMFTQQLWGHGSTTE